MSQIDWKLFSKHHWNFENFFDDLLRSYNVSLILSLYNLDSNSEQFQNDELRQLMRFVCLGWWRWGNTYKSYTEKITYIIQFSPSTLVLNDFKSKAETVFKSLVSSGYEVVGEKEKRADVKDVKSQWWKEHDIE